MLKIIRCGFFLISPNSSNPAGALGQRLAFGRRILFLLHFFCITASCFCEQDTSFSLEPIIITKEKQHALNTYLLKEGYFDQPSFSSPLEYLTFSPLDLQSRSLKGGVQADFSLRGSGSQGVLMLLDGKRVNDPQTAHYNCDIPVTIEDIQSVEVIPGASSSFFGTDAIGGAVNILLKKPQEKEAVLRLSAGGFHSQTQLFSLTQKNKNCGVRISLENSRSEGFSEDTDYKKFTAHFSSLIDLPDAELNTVFGYQNSKYGAFDFYTPGMGYPSFEWTRTYLAKSDLTLDKNGLTIKPSLLWRRHEDKFTLDKSGTRSRYQNRHQNDIYTPGVYFQKDLSFLGITGAGLEYGQETIDSTNLGKHNRVHKSIFADNSKDLAKKFSLNSSLRWDDFDSFGIVYSGSCILKFNIRNKDVLNIGVSRNIRIPSFTELYYNDPTTVGDSALSAENSWNYQFGYESKSDVVSYGLVFFLRQEKGFIDWVKRASSQVKWQVENISDAQFRGMEGSLKLRANKIISIDSNYTYTEKHTPNNNYLYKYGPNFTRHLFNSALIFDFPSGRQDISCSYKKKPSRGGWIILSSHLSHKLSKSCSLFFNASNLLDVEYQEIEGIPQPGRYFEGGVRLQW